MYMHKLAILKFWSKLGKMLWRIKKKETSTTGD